MPKSDLGNTQDLVTIADIRENAVLIKNGGLRQIVMVGGFNFALKSEAEQNVITTSYRDFLNGLDFSIQIVIHSRKLNIERYLSGLERRLSEEPSGLLQNQIVEYREFVRSFVKENAIMTKTFLVVVPWYPTALPKKENVFAFFPSRKKGGDEERKKRGGEEFREGLGQLGQRVNQVIEGLTALGLTAVLLSTEELVELFYNFYNPEAIERENVAPPQAPPGSTPK